MAFLWKTKKSRKGKHFEGKNTKCLFKNHFPQADETTGWIKDTQQEVNNVEIKKKNNKDKIVFKANM